MAQEMKAPPDEPGSASLFTYYGLALGYAFEPAVDKGSAAHVDDSYQVGWSPS